MVNAEQSAHWNTAAGPRWATLADRTDRLFNELTSALLTFADPQTGEAVLDVGCGCGVTSLAAARAVGAAGSVLGVDFSAPMLAVAERRARDAGLTNTRFIETDAALHTFDAQQFDLLVSQLGVMFFDEPVRAFANLYGALRPGGRLRVACFRSLTENDWFSVPLAAARKVVNVPPPGNPTAPGPTSLADPDHLRSVLRAAASARSNCVRSTSCSPPEPPPRPSSSFRASDRFREHLPAQPTSSEPPSPPHSRKLCATTSRPAKSNSAPASGSSAPAHERHAFA